MKKTLKILAIFMALANLVPTVLCAEKKPKLPITRRETLDRAHNRVPLQELLFLAADTALTFTVIKNLKLDLKGLENIKRDATIVFSGFLLLLTAGIALLGANFYHYHANPMCLI
jgi:hypothetical protein